MSVWFYLLLWGIGFGASAVGAVCGIGGGVLMKPVLDSAGILDVSSVSFLSGCTVLAMAGYSVLAGGGNARLDLKISTPLALGAAAGGVLGRALLKTLENACAYPDRVGAVQAACLLAVTMGTLIVTRKRAHIRHLRVEHPAACACAGFALGSCSAFLGIGGGPMNLAVLCCLFSMETKTAAANSLYVILFSQTAALIQSIVSGTVPKDSLGLIVLMAAGGLMGGAAGRRLNRRMDGKTVDRLFLALLVGIMAICVYNLARFA